MPDGQAHKRKMFDNLIRAIETDIRNADKQTRDTRETFGISDALGVLVLINAGARTLVPDTIRYGLERTLSKVNLDGSYRYPHNTGIILITELHSIQQAGMTLFPIINMQHPSKAKSAEFNKFSSFFIDAWARFNGAPLIDTTTSELFRAR